MIKIVCPDCQEEKGKFEIINVSAQQRKYEIRCPDCDRAFVVYGQDVEGQPPAPPDREENPES